MKIILQEKQNYCKSKLTLCHHKLKWSFNNVQEFLQISNKTKKNSLNSKKFSLCKILNSECYFEISGCCLSLYFKKADVSNAKCIKVTGNMISDNTIQYQFSDKIITYNALKKQYTDRSISANCADFSSTWRLPIQMEDCNSLSFFFEITDEHDANEINTNNEIKLTEDSLFKFHKDQSFLTFNSNINFYQPIDILHQHVTKLYNNSNFALTASHNCYSQNITINFLLKFIPKFFKEKQLFDINFSIHENDIKAHSLVLAAISPYFFAMFDCENIEKSSRKINLSNDPDFTAEILKGFLDYVYGIKKIGQMEDIIFDLFVVADKYNIICLKNVIEDFLSENIKLSNICQLLVLVETYDMDSLKHKALNFAKSYFKEINQTNDFKELLVPEKIMKSLYTVAEMPSICEEPQQILETEFILYNTRFEWSITNFEERLQRFKAFSNNLEKIIKSGTFPLNGVEKTCYLELTLKMSSYYNSYEFSVRLFIPKLKDLKFIFANLSIIKEGNVLFTKTQESLSPNEDCFKFNIPIHDTDLIQNIETYLDNDSLIFNITINCVIEELVNNCKNEREILISKKIQQFYTENQLIDLIFKIGGKELKAHKLVVAASSKYFYEMFNNDQKSAENNLVKEVDLSNDADVSYESVKGYLDFIYGCKSIVDLKNMVNELLILSSKFEVFCLRESCGFLLSQTMNQENLLDLLILAEKYNCDVLRGKALDMAHKNLKTLEKTSKFEEIFKYKNIVADLLQL